MMDYPMVNYVDGYYETYAGQETEEEEEWDRQAYLDPMWEIQQKKTFTAWCNSYLRKISTSISNIEEDFQNGLKLIQLLETLSEEQLPKPDRGRMRFHKIANVNKALEYIESKGVQLVSIGAEEIVDGNIKMTLGMIWTIILRFCIQDITVEEMSAKEGLLLWCQRKTSPYKNVNVQNFHMSWKDGLAFCALIHRHRPDLIDYAKLSRDNPMENLNYAFDVAEKHLDIPRMLDAEDMVNTVRPDERSVMTYVAAYYHALAGPQKAESAVSRISKVLASNKENKKLMEAYENLASDLLSWINQKVLFLKDRDFDNTIPGACKKLGQYHAYRRGEKPPRLDDKTTLENLFNTLQTRLRIANRPNFLPAEGHLISDINSAWREMENYEKGFEDWLINEIKRLEQIELLVKKFHLKCSIHEEWTSDKPEELENEDYEDANLLELRAMSHKHAAFEADLGAHQTRVERIVAIAEELNSLRYSEVKSVNERTEKIVSEWDRLGQLSQKRKENITKILDFRNRLDRLQASFAKRVEPFNSWLEQVQEDLQDMFIVNKVEEIIALLNGHENFKKTLSSAEREMTEMLMDASQAEALVKEHNLVPELAENPYTMIDYKTLKSRWEAMASLIPLRDQELQTELLRQQDHERIRRKFADLANRLGPTLERYLDTAHRILTATEVRLDDQLTQLQKLEEEVQSIDSSFEELNKAVQEVQEARITHNPYTRYSMDTLGVGREQLKTNLKRGQNEIENQILARDYRGVTEKQMEEFRRCFNHFDRQRRRRLDPLDFRACLVSLGYNIPNNPKGEADFQRILRSVDPNGVGYITFDSFINFMNRQTSEVESAEALAELFNTIAGDRPYITAEQLRKELPGEQAEYCIQRMMSYANAGEVNGEALDYASFANQIYGESDM